MVAIHVVDRESHDLARPQVEGGQPPALGQREPALAVGRPQHDRRAVDHRVQVVLALPQGGLGEPLRGDVRDHREDRAAAGVDDAAPGHLDVDPRAVLPAVTPRAGLAQEGRLRRSLPHLGQQVVQILGHADLAEGELQEIILRVAVAARRRGVHGQETEGGDVEDPGRLGVGLEQQSGQVPALQARVLLAIRPRVRLAHRGLSLAHP